MKATVVFEKNWNFIHDENIRYIINSGSSRSSKTHSIIQLFYLYALENPNTKLSVFRDTKKICKDTVLADMKKIYPTMPSYDKVVLNITESIFKFRNGSTIHIEGTDDAVKMHGYHTDVLWFNESYNISKDTFDQLDMRCSGKVIIDLNPRQGHWSDELTKSKKSIKIHSTFKDNPFCPIQQKEKILSYQPVKLCSLVKDGYIIEEEAKRYDLSKNQLEFEIPKIKELSRCINNENRNTANEFNWQVYGLGEKAERPNRIFHWTEIPIDAFNAIKAPDLYAVDWGAVDPMGVLHMKYYDGGLYLHELNYDSENKIREKLTATELSQIDNTEEGLVMWKFRKMNINPEKVIVCDSNRPLKILALRRAGFEYAISATKGAGSVIDGIDLLNSLKVYYTNTSANLKYEQENYSRKVDRYGIVLEEPEDLDNHLIDPARYGAEYWRKEGLIRNI